MMSFGPRHFGGTWSEPTTIIRGAFASLIGNAAGRLYLAGAGEVAFALESDLTVTVRLGTRVMALPIERVLHLCVLRAAGIEILLDRIEASGTVRPPAGFAPTKATLRALVQSRLVRDSRFQGGARTACVMIVAAAAAELARGGCGRQIANAGARLRRETIQMRLMRSGLAAAVGAIRTSGEDELARLPAEALADLDQVIAFETRVLRRARTRRPIFSAAEALRIAA